MTPPMRPADSGGDEAALSDEMISLLLNGMGDPETPASREADQRLREAASAAAKAMRPETKKQVPDSGDRTEPVFDLRGPSPLLARATANASPRRNPTAAGEPAMDGSDSQSADLAEDNDDSSSVNVPVQPAVAPGHASDPADDGVNFAEQRGEDTRVVSEVQFDDPVFDDAASSAESGFAAGEEVRAYAGEDFRAAAGEYVRDNSGAVADDQFGGPGGDDHASNFAVAAPRPWASRSDFPDAAPSPELVDPSGIPGTVDSEAPNWGEPEPDASAQYADEVVDPEHDEFAAAAADAPEIDGGAVAGPRQVLAEADVPWPEEPSAFGGADVAGLPDEGADQDREDFSEPDRHDQAADAPASEPSAPADGGFGNPHTFQISAPRDRGVEDIFAAPEGSFDAPGLTPEDDAADASGGSDDPYGDAPAPRTRMSSTTPASSADDERPSSPADQDDVDESDDEVDEDRESGEPAPKTSVIASAMAAVKSLWATVRGKFSSLSPMWKLGTKVVCSLAAVGLVFGVIVPKLMEDDSGNSGPDRVVPIPEAAKPENNITDGVIEVNASNVEADCANGSTPPHLALSSAQKDAWLCMRYFNSDNVTLTIRFDQPVTISRISYVPGWNYAEPSIDNWAKWRVAKEVLWIVGKDQYSQSVTPTRSGVEQRFNPPVSTTVIQMVIQKTEPSSGTGNSSPFGGGWEEASDGFAISQMKIYGRNSE